MKNKYIWLYNNLDRYQYNTKQSKELYNRIKSIQVNADGDIDDKSFAELEKCYEEFIKLFNDNPFAFKTGFREYAIETKEVDCYFLKTGEGLVPVELYRDERTVESVLLINQKIERQKKRTLDIKSKTIADIQKNSDLIQEGYKNLKNQKKAYYIRGLIGVFAIVMVIYYLVQFLTITDIANIIKSIPEGWSNTAKSISAGMAHMPVFKSSSIFGWFVFLIIHIYFAVVIVKNIKNIYNEFKLAYNKTVTSSFAKKSANVIKKINSYMDDQFGKDEQLLYEFARQGKNSMLEKNNIAKIIKSNKKRALYAQDYIKTTKLRGIAKNSTLVMWLIVVLIGFFSYFMMTNSNISTKVYDCYYSINIKADNVFLRGKKVVQLNVEECPVFQTTSEDSYIKQNVSIWTEVEVIKQKNVNDVSWTKIKKNTDKGVIKGWVPTRYTTPYNKISNEDYAKVPVESVWATSYLQGSSVAYVPEYAIDGNRYTSWQDGNELTNGKNESIVLEFGEQKTVDVICIFPGDSKSEKMFYDNARIKKARLKFSDGNSVTYNFDDTFDEEYQTIWLNKPVDTSSVEITMVDVYDGLKYEELSVGEIAVYEKIQNEEVENEA